MRRVIYIVLITIISISVPGFGQIEWAEHDITGGLNYAIGAKSVYAIDVDSDDDVDLLSASNDGKIAWYENTGETVFTFHIITTEAVGANSVFAIDIDTDGDTDVLSASGIDDKIAWYENDGQENFISHIINKIREK